MMLVEVLGSLVGITSSVVVGWRGQVHGAAGGYRVAPVELPGSEALYRRFGGQCQCPIARSRQCGDPERLPEHHETTHLTRRLADRKE